MELASIASGSNGNCILVKHNNTNILVDVGISKKRIVEGLEHFDTKPSDIDAILITHEHADHIKGLGVYLRAFETEVYTMPKTISYLKNEADLGPVDYKLFNTIESETIQIGNVSIKPIHVTHDAAEPVCYRFEAEGSSLAVVTDLGCYDSSLVDNLMDLDAILIESNHDLNMLQVGPYPYNLKMRIWGKNGHLSNDTCSKLLSEIVSDKMKHIVLGHLSGENNYPDLAFQTVRNELESFADNDLTIKVAARKEPSVRIEI